MPLGCSTFIPKSPYTRKHKLTGKVSFSNKGLNRFQTKQPAHLSIVERLGRLCVAQKYDYFHKNHSFSQTFYVFPTLFYFIGTKAFTAFLNDLLYTKRCGTHKKTYLCKVENQY